MRLREMGNGIFPGSDPDVPPGVDPLSPHAKPLGGGMRMAFFGFRCSARISKCPVRLLESSFTVAQLDRLSIQLFVVGSLPQFCSSISRCTLATRQTVLPRSADPIQLTVPPGFLVSLQITGFKRRPPVRSSEPETMAIWPFFLAWNWSGSYRFVAEPSPPIFWTVCQARACCHPQRPMPENMPATVFS